MSRQSKADQAKIIRIGVTHAHLTGHRAGPDTQQSRLKARGAKPHKGITQARREDFATRHNG